MSCQSVREVLSAFLDRRLSGEESRDVSGHLMGCSECAKRSEELSELRRGLGRLRQAMPPKWLGVELLVMASQECVRARNRSSLALQFHNWFERLKLTSDNLMRPMALPVAGGLVSALFLFSMLLPHLRVLAGPLNMTPTGLFTEPTIATTSPFGVSDEVLVELLVDQEGRIVDYAVADSHISREVQAQIGNMILFTSFNPATAFGRPTAGRVWVSFRRSHIVVKG
ncbi:MAG: zf-HC2 domain-containing protein [Bryobacterales bacterium]|nr:zf-HC2 domain-containing protein [Bryobacterales bacterium]